MGLPAVIASLGIALLVGARAAASAERDEPMALSIAGPAGSAFSGTCTYRRGGRVETLQLEGRVPFATEIRGDGLQCRITTAQQISVEARKSGNVTRAATSGGTVNLRLD